MMDDDRYPAPNCCPPPPLPQKQEPPLTWQSRPTPTPNLPGALLFPVWCFMLIASSLVSPRLSFLHGSSSPISYVFVLHNFLPWCVIVSPFFMVFCHRSRLIFSLFYTFTFDIPLSSPTRSENMSKTSLSDCHQELLLSWLLPLTWALLFLTDWSRLFWCGRCAE